MEALVAFATPVAVACYVGQKVDQHRPHWYVVPKGWKLPKVEVACNLAAIGSLMVVALILG